MKKILITICARGGSKGIPGKNIKELNGKPLLAYTLKVAQQFASQHGADIALSTDSELIRKVASDLGLETDYLRPEYLATDGAGKIDAIHDLLLYQEKVKNQDYDFVLDLDLTSPLRTLEDLNLSFLHFKETGALTLFSVNPAARNPYFNMVEKNEQGFYTLIKTNPDGSVLSRQKAPLVYDLNASFYWYKRSFFEMNLKTPITPESTIYEMPHICFDLDHPIDFEFLSYLISNDKINGLL